MMGLAALVLLGSTATALPAQRAVLAELFGSSWCGHCPKSRAALRQMQTAYGKDRLVNLYWHVNDTYSTPETQARGTYYFVGGVPETDWDSVTECLGAPVDTATTKALYEPIYAARTADSTPVVVRTRGFVKDDPDTSWIEATFKAVEPVSYGPLRAQFVVYENLPLYPWSVRDVLPTAEFTLSAAGDSVTVLREFVVSPSWNHANCWAATFIEKVNAPRLLVNAQYMRDPYGIQMTPVTYAAEIPYFGMGRYDVDIKNTGTMADSLRVSITPSFPPEVGPYEWIALYCDDSHVCYMFPTTFYFAPGQTRRFSVEIADYIGTVRGLGRATLTVASRSNGSLTGSAEFAAFVDLPSILVVDDDGGASYQTHLETAVTDNGYEPYTWSTSAKGRPPLALLGSFWSVLWTTANADGSAITAADEAAMADYLDAGGNLLLSSMGYLSSRTGATAFTDDYLHIASWTNNTSGFIMTGVAGDPISDGMALGLGGGPFPPSGSETIVTEAPADDIFAASGAVKALKVAENEHCAVFLSFPFEDVKTADADPNNQRTLLRRILHWFGPIPTGVGEQPARLSLGQNFPNPFNPTTTLSFTVPADAGRVTLTVHGVTGQVVRTLVDTDGLPAGPHTAVWDGRDADGHAVSSGVYFARLSAGGHTRATKMALLK
jgi:hypothetical protein